MAPASASPQPSLFDAPTTAPEPVTTKRPALSMAQSFEQFHADNPRVLETLRQKALDAKASGMRTYGIGAMFEQIRWDASFRTNGQPFKLNNNYRAAYARLLMETTPELRGFFRLRD